jgi:vancomycin resistance protein VanJ
MHKLFSPVVPGWAYTLLIGLWLLLRALFFDRLWWLAMVNTVALYLFLPLVILIPLALWQRAWPLLLGLSLPLLAFVYFFGALFIAAPTAADASQGRQITAMTLNMLWSNEDDAAILAAIRQARPDLIGLQEVKPATQDRLTRLLAAEYPYVAQHPARQFHDVLLLSRFPIEAVTASFEQPIGQALRATVLVNGRSLAVFVAHLPPSNFLRYPLAQFATYTASRYDERLREAQSLAQELRRVGGPALLLCDCNLTSTSEAYAALQTAAIDSFPGAGWGFGHTVRMARIPLLLLRIDYVWHTAELTAQRAYVGPAVGSDHRPLIAELRFVR